MDWWETGMKTALLWQRAAMVQQAMWLSAAEVVWWRGFEMAAGSFRSAEAVRMVFEKPAAFAEGIERGAIAAAKGQGPEKVVEAFVRPIGQKTRSNVYRLRQRNRRKT